MLNVSKIKIFAISILVFFSSATCKKDKFAFPYVTINANIGIYSDLGDLAQGNVKIFPKERFGGVGGLIIYRDFDDKYTAFDAACTYDYFNNCILKISNSFQELMECPCCNSSFLLSSEGNVFKSPATYPLQQYSAFTDGSILRVVN
jgi:nitrite reductase/ring-hydroxylating ferredoxin subunit